MKGNVCVITGASSGIGKATALRLAGMGMTVAIVARDQERGQAAQAEIKAASVNPDVDLLVADLSSLAEVRWLAGEVQSWYPSLHVLINNAGVAPIKRQVTADGLEMAFAVNYLAPFLLTNLLLDTLKAGAPARVVNVAGDFHRKATMRFDDTRQSMPWIVLPGLIFGILCGAVLLTWLYNGTGGSLLMVAIWHALFDLVSASKAGQDVMPFIATAGVIAWALIVANVNRPWGFRFQEKHTL